MKKVWVYDNLKIKSLIEKENQGALVVGLHSTILTSGKSTPVFHRCSQFSWAVWADWLSSALKMARDPGLAFWSNTSSWPLWLVWTGHLTQSEVIRADPVIFAGALGNKAYRFSLFLNLVEYKPKSSGVYQVQTACLRGKAVQEKNGAKTEGKFLDAIISGPGPRWAQRNSSSYKF